MAKAVAKAEVDDYTPSEEPGKLKLVIIRT